MRSFTIGKGRESNVDKVIGIYLLLSHAAILLLIVLISQGGKVGSVFRCIWTILIWIIVIGEIKVYYSSIYINKLMDRVDRLQFLYEYYQVQNVILKERQEDWSSAQGITRQIDTYYKYILEMITFDRKDCIADSLKKVWLIKKPNVENRYCSIPAIDALVGIKTEVANRKKIDVSLDIAISGSSDIDPVELCRVFSNLFDNAFASLEALPETRRHLTCRARVSDGWLLIEANNPVAGGKQRIVGSGLSRHGWGLSIIEDIAHKYGGIVKHTIDNGIWRTSIVMRYQS